MINTKLVRQKEMNLFEIDLKSILIKLIIHIFIPDTS